VEKESFLLNKYNQNMNRENLFGIHNILFCAVLFCLGLASCITTKKTTIDTKDLSYLYNPTKSSIKPYFSVFNETDESSVLSVGLIASQLFFSQANPLGVDMAQVLITAKLFNITNERFLVDTAFIDADIIKVESQQEYIYKLPLKVEHGNDYIIEVKLLDQLRQEIIQSFVTFDTKSYSNKYNFIAREHFSKNELFNPVVRVNSFFNLTYPVKPVDSLFVSFYQPLNEVPYPPSILLPEKIIDYPPDTIIALQYSDTLPLMFPDEGIYFCSAERDSEEGYTFFNFGETFPLMTDPLTMIKPLAYLASQEEMNKMLSSPRPKTGLDEFWTNCGGNIDKSRELIRIYYTRIIYSNYYFTSFKEGWRTERGMIYTIYGPPDKVYKSSSEESWGYRKPVLKSSWGGRYRLKEEYLFFNFRIRKSKYSDNDFYLIRNETLVSNWDRAVATWRKGIVFRLDNPEDL
jgi:GWxTD domain-containing protein